MSLVFIVILKLFIWLMIAYGVTQIITDSSLFAPIRNAISIMPFMGFLSKLVTCFLCTSVWVCFFFSWTLWSPTEEFFDSNYYFFLDGMFGSAVLWFLRTYENKLSS